MSDEYQEISTMTIQSRKENSPKKMYLSTVKRRWNVQILGHFHCVMPPTFQLSSLAFLTTTIWKSDNFLEISKAMSIYFRAQQWDLCFVCVRLSCKIWVYQQNAWSTHECTSRIFMNKLKIKRIEMCCRHPMKENTRRNKDGKSHSQLEFCYETSLFIINIIYMIDIYYLIFKFVKKKFFQIAKVTVFFVVC